MHNFSIYNVEILNIGLFDKYQIGMKCIKDRLSKSNLSDRNCIAIQNQNQNQMLKHPYI